MNHAGAIRSTGLSKLPAAEDALPGLAEDCVHQRGLDGAPASLERPETLVFRIAPAEVKRVGTGFTPSADALPEDKIVRPK